jgi:adenylate cyclase
VLDFSHPDQGESAEEVRIRYSFQGNDRVFDQPLDVVLIGRPRPDTVVEIDLSPDGRASRVHARIRRENGGFSIEDLKSKNGTTLDNHEIKGKGRVPLLAGQVVRISETELVLEAEPEPEQGPPAEDTTILGKGETVIDLRVDDSQLEISEIVDATTTGFDASAPLDAKHAACMARLYQLPLAVDDKAGFDKLLQRIVEELVKLIPSARRGAMLLKDPAQHDALLLKAHLPAGEPSVSLSLVKRAMTRREGFMWNRPTDPSLSQIANRMQAGIYVPLLWRDDVLGVICIDNNVGGTGTAFEFDDLRLVVSASHHAAALAMQTRMQDELQRKTSTLNRLMMNYSPRVRQHLLRRAHHGRLQVGGGERSEVAILESDIRGFTKLTIGVDADDVVELLNDYFAALVDAISRYDGTVDKFIGDAILAVFFESSDGEPKRHENALNAALAMQEAMATVSARRKARGQVTCNIGIGIHCGEVLHGFIGSHERVELTVIGDAVNLTSRYCNGANPGEILISPEMHQYTWSLIEAEVTTIESKHEGPLPAYRLRKMRLGLSA